MTAAQIGDVQKRIDLGVRRGGIRAAARHKRAGIGISVWRDGKVVHIPANEIEIDESLLADPDTMPAHIEHPLR